MKGLLESTMPQQAPSMPQKQTPVPASQGGPSNPVSDVDQEAIDIFVANGMKMIHNSKISDSIVTLILKSDNPAKAVAESTLRIVERLEASSKTSGKELTLNTIAQGGNMIMGEIIASAEAAGLKKMTDKEKYQAYSLAIATYIDNAIKTGKMTKEQVMQMQKDAESTPEGQKIMETAAAGPSSPAPPPAGSPAVAAPPNMNSGGAV
jgi:hypothetical protein